MKNILALVADFANGIFAVFIASFIFNVEPQWWYFGVGIVLAMSPDIDALPELFKRGKVSANVKNIRDHRTFLHYPIIALSLGALAGVYIGYWGIVWLIAVILHLINDLYGTGWGLPVLWPVAQTHYKFFARRANKLKYLLIESGEWDQVTSHDRKLRVIVSWQKLELPAYIRQFGMDNWIGAYYLRLNFISVVEYSLFGIAVVLLIKYLV